MAGEATQRGLRAGLRAGLSIAISSFCLLVCVGTAHASRGHEFATTFGEPCIAEPCVEGALKKPSGVAVNEATGDVYVVDEGANRVVRFNDKGTFQSEFNGSGLLPGEEHEAGSLGRPEEVETGRFETPEAIAVDNSCVLRKRSEPGLTQEMCEEEDPSNGDVYVVDAGKEHRVIDKYAAGGKYEGQITVGGEGELNKHPIDGVAVDRSGAVFSYQESRLISKYTNATPNTLISSATANVSSFGCPGLAVDAANNLYVCHGDNRIAEVDPSGTLIFSELDDEFSSAVAVDQTTSASFVDNLTTVAVFEGASNGAPPVERLGEEGGVKRLVAGAGVGVDAGRESIYVADSSAQDVVVFGPQEPSAPKVESESVVDITSDGATVGARINPHSEPSEASTEYRFQFGRCGTPATCPESGYEASTPLEFISPDFEVHSVSARLEALQSNATYHFRVIVSNAHGVGAAGGEETFTTERSGAPLALPDDRGWELVSPPDKQGASIEPIKEWGQVQAAADGHAITYIANAPTEQHSEGNNNEVQVLSRRSFAAWTSRDIAIPHLSPTGVPVGLNSPGPEYKFFSPELTLSLCQPFGEFNPLLSDEASESTAYLHDLSGVCGSSCYRPLVTGQPGFANVPDGTQFGEEEKCKPKSEGTTAVACGPEVVGATEDLIHVVLSAGVPLAVGAVPNELYEWSGGTLTPVSVLPANGPAVAGVLGGEAQGEGSSAHRAVSTDGSRIVWSTPTGLYVRDLSRDETVQLDKAACGGCTSGGGQFQVASADGSRVFFTDANRLTEDSGAESEKPDLYECQIVVSGSNLACELSDLTPGAGVLGKVLGASEDGAYVYFVADGVLSEAENARKAKAVNGQPNLYVQHDGDTEFITTLSGGDEHDWAKGLGLYAQPTRVSNDGRWLELMSQTSLTGYDNRDVKTGKPVAEVYLYDAASRQLRCASCMPTGERPVGVEYTKLQPTEGGLVGGPRFIWTDSLVAANVPGWPTIGVTRSRQQPRYLNDEGRLFFDAADSLVPQDSNKTQDVYEYEPPGVGSCTEASDTFRVSAAGCVSLISSGTSSRESALLDASESGDDVFFLTAAKLTSLDRDNAMDVYDAHVCTDAAPCITYSSGGEQPCGEGSCRPSPTPQPSIFGAPASATLSGPGNLSPAPLPPKEETEAQKLAKALKACQAKKNKHKRKLCVRAAQKKYGSASSKAQKLAKALKACQAKKNKHKRKLCVRAARKRYGPAKNKTGAKKSRRNAGRRGK